MPLVGAIDRKFSERGVFRSRLDGVLNHLIGWEQTSQQFLQLRRLLETGLQDLPDNVFFSF